METRKFRLTFTEPVLGTCPGNKEIMSDFIGGKNPNGLDPSEVAAVPDVDEELQKATTFFARSPDGKPMIWDYQVKGFLKDAALAAITSGEKKEVVKDGKKKMVRNPMCGMSEWTYKRTIDQLVFVGPRMIPFSGDPAITFTERPLRASTMKGDRVALAKSETIPAGTTIEISISVLRADLWQAVEWALEYGVFRGIGQWRNSGMGRFTYEEITQA